MRLMSELVHIYVLVGISVSIMANIGVQTNIKRPTKPIRVVFNAILSPLIMIAFLMYFKFDFVKLDTALNAVWLGVLTGAFSVMIISNVVAMLPSIIKLLIAKWLGIDAKNIQTPEETNRMSEFLQPPKPTDTIEDTGANKTNKEVKKE